MQAAKLHPRCIVQDYLYADVAVMVAPGGTGKTTLVLREFVSIILGLPLYGLDVVSPGPCLLISAEDWRGIAVARLREIMNAMDLTSVQKRKVRESLLIWDVTGEIRRLTELDEHGNVILTPLADAIAKEYPDGQLSVIQLDPAVNFGVGERLVNDNEQALIMAARRIVRGTNACVRYIHHTGKAVARDQVLDQYAARGGSALPDGARMVAVLQPINSDQESGKNTPPAGFSISPSDESGVVLARPKLSYTRPNLPLIWIKRHGYHFEYLTEVKQSASQQRYAYAAQLYTFLTDQLKQSPPRYHTKTSLETEGVMPRDKLRRAINDLLLDRHIQERGLPESQRHGGKKTYLHPVSEPNAPTPPKPDGGVDVNSDHFSVDFLC